MKKLFLPIAICSSFLLFAQQIITKSIISFNTHERNSKTVLFEKQDLDHNINFLLKAENKTSKDFTKCKWITSLSQDQLIYFIDVLENLEAGSSVESRLFNFVYKKNKIKIGFVTSTTKNNVDGVFKSLKYHLKKNDFDYIGHDKIIKTFKDKSDIYKHCLKKLNVKSSKCVAIEDTEISLSYARKAKVRCIAFPGDFHLTGKFNDSLIKVRRLNPKIFSGL